MGGAITIAYTFSTTTTDADPGNGFLRLSSATENTSTVIRTDLQDTGGISWSSVLATFADSTNTVKGHIRLVNPNDTTKWLLFTVSAVASPTGYKNITVSNIGSSSASPFANNDPVTLTFDRTGDVGATGATGATGVSSYTSTTATFTQPSVGSNVSVSVSNTAWMVAGETLFVQTGGYYSVSSITNGTTVVLTNLGYDGNTSVGSTGNGGSVTPGGATPPVPSSSWVTSSESTTSSSYANLTTTQTVTVSVTSTGDALVSIATQMYASTSNSGDGCAMAFSVSGTGGFSAADSRSVMLQNTTGVLNPGTSGGGTWLVTGLSAGSHDFTLKFKALSGTTCTYSNRSLVVTPY